MITTHVLDTARGRPAEGVPVVLERAAATAGSCWAAAHRRRRPLRDLVADGRRSAPGATA